MMRYQRTSPDVLPLSNGRKPTLKVCKEDDPDNGRRMTNYSHLEAKPLRGRPGSSSGSANHSPARDLHFHHVSYPSDSPPSTVPAHNETIPLPPSAPSSTAVSPAKSGSHGDANGVIHSGGGSGDLLLQWGHNKRSRRSRTESRSAATSIPAGAGDEPAAHSRQTGKIQRRSAIAAAEKVAAVVAASAAMPPPCGGSYGGRGGNVRPCTPLRDATSQAISNSKGADERSSGVNRSEKRSPSSPPEKAQKTSAGSTPNGAGSMHPESKQHHPSDQETGGGSGTTTAVAVAAAGGTGEKMSLEHFEWPRIYISLSRKEKEDDFLAMKGTKLPQRPKKRAKNVDKTLQYCFPGMWLSDLTRGRYEVREKKCVKKKRRGLKGMEGMDSDSE